MIYINFKTNYIYRKIFLRIKLPCFQKETTISMLSCLTKILNFHIIKNCIIHNKIAPGIPNIPTTAAVIIFKPM